MPKKPSRKGRQSKSVRIHDLPMKAKKIEHSDKVVGGGVRKGTGDTTPTESISLPFYKPGINY